MGRKRTKDFELPPRLHRKGGAFYYVTHPGRKWIPLGSDLGRAKRKWADLECMHDGETVDSLIERYLADCIAKRAASTAKRYKLFRQTIAKEWGPLPVNLLQSWQIARYRDRAGVGKVWANGVISLLRVAYAKAVEWGWVNINPAAAVAFNETSVRDRYLKDDEFRAIRANAPDWMRTAMDLAYLTAMRPSDLVALKWEDVGDSIAVRQRKTRTRHAFNMTPELEAVLASARERPILGLYVVASAKGRPISERRLQKAWRAAATAAGICDAQFRDIRAKAATDAEAEGMNYQALLGHTTRQMSDRYVKAKRTIRAQPLGRRL